VQSINVSLFVLEPPCLPVSRATASMGDGDDLNGHICHPVNYGVGKTPEREFSCAVQMQRPALRTFVNFTDGMIECRYESVCSGGIALSVPLIRNSCFHDRVRMEFNVWTSHGIVREFGVGRRAREPFSLFPYPNRQCVARSPYSTLLPRPHPPSYLNFRSDDRRAQRALPQEDAAPLPKPFCGLSSWNKFYNSRARQHKFKAREVR
jgi:hypothetical protein